MKSAWFRLFLTSIVLFSTCFSIQLHADCVRAYQELTLSAKSARTRGGVGYGVGAGATALGGVGSILLSVTGWGLVVVGVAAVGGFIFGRYNASQEVSLSRQLDVLNVYQQAKAYLAENPVVSAESPRMPLDLAVFVAAVNSDPVNPSQDLDGRTQTQQEILMKIVKAMDQGVLCPPNQPLFNSASLYRLIIQGKI